MYRSFTVLVPNFDLDGGSEVKESYDLTEDQGQQNHLTLHYLVFQFFQFFEYETVTMRFSNRYNSYGQFTVP